MDTTLKSKDEKIYNIIHKELKRQQNNIELIASENFVSLPVLEAQGSILTNKYAEGYPAKRYYGGCEHVDEIETLAKDRLKELFDVQYVNVQPHSGSQANMAVYRALLNHGDKVLGMALDHGGHLTHGYKANFSGVDYEFVSYTLDKDSQELDYDNIRQLALLHKPKMIVAGASAYSKVIDFKKFRDIADLVGAYLFVDMAHIAGLVAGGVHPNPVPYADIVTSTTHKTLRGPRGGIILTNNKDIAKKINSAIFPGIQGGPLMHVIAAKAVCFKEALSKEFKQYQQQVVDNAKTLAQELKKFGYTIVSGGTDNHLLIVDVMTSVNMTGKQAQSILDSVNITTNKNTIPFDTQKPTITSGIRLGTPSITTRGFGTKETIKVAHLIDEALKNFEDKDKLDKVKQQVVELTDKFVLNYS